MNNTNRKIPWAVVVPLATTVALVACGGGSGGSSTSTSSRSFTVPSEISAVPVSSSSSSAPATPRSFGSAIRSLAKAATAAGLPANSDYVTTKGKTYVEERTLEQFEIIETVFSAIGQTGYADMIGEGAYQAVVSWEEEQDGRDVKQLQTWTVQADLVTGQFPNGTTDEYLRLRAWIPETDPMDGSESLIKAEFSIYEDATQADDGSYTDFGTWDMNVLFNADASGVDSGVGNDGYFAASARKTTNGSSLTIHEVFGARDFGAGGEVKAILIRDGDTGYGQVAYPDFDSCWSDFAQNGNGDPNSYSCTPQTKTAQYAYTDRDFALSTDGGTTVTYKDRALSGAIKMVHRYGLFYADAGADNGVTHAEGENVLKQLSFGFPVNYQATPQGSGQPFTAFAYYGSWQGRHQVWGPGGYTAEGGGTPTTFTRADDMNGTPATYTLVEFPGTLSKRDVVEASLNDIKNVATEVFINTNADVFWDGTNWKRCDGIVDWSQSPIDPTNAAHCRDRSNFANNANPGWSNYDMSTLEVSAGDSRWVNIGRWDSTLNGGNGGDVQYIYLSQTDNRVNFTAAGLYPAQWGNNGLESVQGGSVWAPNAGDNVFTSVGGSIFVEYVGGFDGSAPTGWKQKNFTGYSDRTGQPEFDEQAAEQDFSPSRDSEYYMNVNGANFIVKRKAATDAATSYDVRLELQTAAHPGNSDSSQSMSILPTGADYLAFPWDRSTRYYFEENPNDTDSDSDGSNEYLQLRVLADDTGTAQQHDEVAGQWGLVAYDDNGTPNDTTDDVMLDGSGTAVTVDEFGFPTASTRPAEFNWEKPQSWESWGKQQFLKDSNGDYVVLSNPITLLNVGVTDSIGNPYVVRDADGNMLDSNGGIVTDAAQAEQKTFTVQYDGFTFGLPDMYGVLAENGWEMTQDIAGKVMHVPAGTKVSGPDITNGSATVEYFMKPLDTSLFLGTITAQSITDAGRTPPSLTDVTTNADLSTVPDYTAHNMGATPANVEVKYSEGEAVQ